MDQNQNTTSMPVARLDPAVMNLDPSLSHLDKSALPTTKDNASRCLGDGPAFIDAIKIPFFNSTAESRKELTGTTADEQGMRITNPAAGATNFNAPVTSTVTQQPGIAPPRAYANTGSSMFQRAEESGLAAEQQLPTGPSTFGPGGPTAGGPAYAYNQPHDLITSAGPTRPPVGVNDQLQQEQRDDNTADNSNLVAARGAFNDPTISSGQNLADPNLNAAQQQQQQQIGGQHSVNVDDVIGHTRNLNLDERPAGFMVGDVPPTRFSETSEQLQQDSTPFDRSERLPGTFIASSRDIRITEDRPALDSALQQEIQSHPQLHHTSGIQLDQQDQGFSRSGADASYRSTHPADDFVLQETEQQGFQPHHGLQRDLQQQQQLPVLDPALQEEIQSAPQLHHVDAPIESSQVQLGRPINDATYRSDLPADDYIYRQDQQQLRDQDIQSESSFSQLSRNIDEDRQVNHPEFSSVQAGSTGLDQSTGQQRYQTYHRDIPVQTISQDQQDQQGQQQQFQGIQFQGASQQERPVVGPAEPFQPGVHSGLRYAEPTEGLPGHSTYRA